MNIDYMLKLAGLYETNGKYGDFGDNEYPEGHALGQGRKEDLEYTEKMVKGKLDRVTVELEGRPSASATKLLKKYKELEDKIDEMSKERNKINVQLKDFVVSLFDAEDEIATRIVETVSATLTMGKREVRKSTKLNSDEFLEKLYEMLNEMVPELVAKVKDLQKQYTSFSETEVSPKLMKPKFKKVKEAAGENQKQELAKKISDLYLKKTKLWGESFDNKIDKIYDELT